MTESEDQGQKGRQSADSREAAAFFDLLSSAFVGFSAPSTAATRCGSRNTSPSTPIEARTHAKCLFVLATHPPLGYQLQTRKLVRTRVAGAELTLVPYRYCVCATMSSYVFDLFDRICGAPIDRFRSMKLLWRRYLRQLSL